MGEWPGVSPYGPSSTGRVRDLGNVETAEKGADEHLGERVVRRKVYRSTNSVPGRFLRKLGCGSRGRAPGKAQGWPGLPWTADSSAVRGPGY